MSDPRKTGQTFAEFRQKHGFTSPMVPIETDVSIDVIKRRVENLEKDLVDHLPKEEEADHGKA